MLDHHLEHYFRSAITGHQGGLMMLVRDLCLDGKCALCTQKQRAGFQHIVSIVHTLENVETAIVARFKYQARHISRWCLPQFSCYHQSILCLEVRFDRLGAGLTSMFLLVIEELSAVFFSQRVNKVSKILSSFFGL